MKRGERTAAQVEAANLSWIPCVNKCTTWIRTRAERVVADRHAKYCKVQKKKKEKKK